MNRKAGIMIMALGAALFTQCKKEKNNDYDFSCATSQDSIAITIFVDGQSKGLLPVVTDGLEDCSDPRGLRFSLPAGEYHVIGKDAAGDTTNEVHLTLQNDEVDSDIIGGTGSVMSLNRCVTLEMQ